MNGKIIEINEEKVKVHLGNFVRETEDGEIRLAEPQ